MASKRATARTLVVGFGLLAVLVGLVSAVPVQHSVAATAEAAQATSVARCQAESRARIIPKIRAQSDPRVRAMLHGALRRHMLICQLRYADQLVGKPSPNSTRPVAVCRLDDPRLPEVSGITYSIRHNNTFWVHNDSGDSARIFAIDANTCRVKAQVRLAGVAAYDFEAIATGRAANGSPVLWIGDIGDNYHRRSHVTLYRISEPATLANRTVRPIATRVVYTNGPQNAEGLLVDPRPGGTVSIVSKENVGRIYTLPRGFALGSTHRVRPGCTVRPYLTDAAMAPDRKRSILRSGNVGSMITSPAACGEPRDFAFPKQRQGEAVSFSRNGAHVYIATEGAGHLIRIPARALPR